MGTSRCLIGEALLVDRHGSDVEVDVRPAQSGGFTAAQAAMRPATTLVQPVGGDEAEGQSGRHPKRCRRLAAEAMFVPTTFDLAPWADGAAPDAARRTWRAGDNRTRWTCISPLTAPCVR